VSINCEDDSGTRNKVLESIAAALAPARKKNNGTRTVLH